MKKIPDPRTMSITSLGKRLRQPSEEVAGAVESYKPIHTLSAGNPHSIPPFLLLRTDRAPPRINGNMSLQQIHIHPFPLPYFPTLLNP